jgi:hypothetical protein
MRRRISPKLLTMGLATLLVAAVSNAAATGFASHDFSPASAFAPRKAAQGAAPITRIELRLFTANRDGAGTDGDVFLGVGGREFFVDSAATGLNDFERGSDYTYRFGDTANVMRAGENDPRSPWQLTYDDFRLAPRYIRLESGGDWDVERADLTVVYSSSGVPGSVPLRRLERNAHLWLGQKRGTIMYFR